MNKHIGNKPKFGRSIGQKINPGHFLGNKQMLSQNKKSNHIRNDVSDGIVNNSNDRDMIYEPNIKYNSVPKQPNHKQPSIPMIEKPKRDHDDTNKKFM
jgi:hypothetical protein